MSTLRIDNNKMAPKHTLRLRATESLISAYVNELTESSREFVESRLALQAYGDAGLGHYTPELIDESLTCECVGSAFYESWTRWWSKIIKEANLREFERGEAVREMLGALIQQKNKAYINDSELREAAERALEWTRWDELNSAKSRLRNSRKYKTCLQAIASGKNWGEAFHLLIAMEREFVRPELGSPAITEGTR